tara:strand:- start:30933 stop:31754 length:822 start_codon:yes stop_codon:yes gene_type:complete
MHFFYYKDQDGFLSQTKIDIEDWDDIRIPNQGDKVISFYDEEKEFYNVKYYLNKQTNNPVFYINGILTEMSQENQLQMLLEKTEVFLNTLYNMEAKLVNCINESYNEDFSPIKAIEHFTKRLADKLDSKFNMDYSKSRLSEEENLELLKNTKNELDILYDIYYTNDEYRMKADLKMTMNAALTLLYSEKEIEVKNKFSDVIELKEFEDIYEEIEDLEIKDQTLYHNIKEDYKAYSTISNIMDRTPYNIREKIYNDSKLFDTNAEKKQRKLKRF